MQKPIAKECNISDLLQNKSYYIDDYQREYKWKKRQIKELIDDLTDKFQENYSPEDEVKKVKEYSSYFLGSILISDKSNNEYIVDGQQRITSLTLLLIYIHNLLKAEGEIDKINSLPSLIYSQSFTENSYNLDIAERNECMDALFNDREDSFQAQDKGESVQNLIDRYRDIKELFPDDIKKCLLNFTWWLISNVFLIKITSFSDDDAYTIFETMNDRGLSLDSTEMLKGYLLANVESNKRKHINDLWKKRIVQLNELGKEEASDFFKNWMRAKYAITTREQKRKDSGYILKDFEIIASAYHKWIRDNKDKIGLKNSDDFYNFVNTEFNFYSNLYIRIRKYENNFKEEYKEIYFNSQNNFTLQILLILAVVKSDDIEEVINKKIKIISRFVDIFIARSLVSFKVLGYSSVMYKIFKFAKDLRNNDLEEAHVYLTDTLKNMEETFENIKTYRLNKQNRKKIHYLLARLTYFIEKESGIPSSFEKYLNKGNHKPFEIEHIVPDKFDRHKESFDSEDDFENTRNKLGNLILLQRGTNQSLSDNMYSEKKKRYSSENLLAQTLCDNCYSSNPNFLNFVKRYGFNFKSYENFEKDEIFERNNLYKTIFESIWTVENIDNLL